MEYFMLRICGFTMVLVFTRCEPRGEGSFLVDGHTEWRWTAWGLR